MKQKLHINYRVNTNVAFNKLNSKYSLFGWHIVFLSCTIYYIYRRCRSDVWTGNSKQCREGATFRIEVLDVLSSRLNLCRLLGHLRPKCGNGVAACSRSQKRLVSSTVKKERKLFGFLPRAVCLRVFHNTIRTMRQAQEMIRRQRDIYIWNDEWRRSRASRRHLREITTTLYYRFASYWTRKIFEMLLELAAPILERNSYFRKNNYIN